MFERELELARPAARAAGEAILSVYRDFDETQVEYNAAHLLEDAPSR